MFVLAHCVATGSVARARGARIPFQWSPGNSWSGRPLAGSSNKVFPIRA
jgi:hypothetical protein